MCIDSTDLGVPGTALDNQDRRAGGPIYAQRHQPVASATTFSFAVTAYYRAMAALTEMRAAGGVATRCG